MAATVSSVENTPRSQYQVHVKALYNSPRLYITLVCVWSLPGNIYSNGFFFFFAFFFFLFCMLEYIRLVQLPPVMLCLQLQKGAVHFAFVWPYAVRYEIISSDFHPQSREVIAVPQSIRRSSRSIERRRNYHQLPSIKLLSLHMKDPI